MIHKLFPLGTALIALLLLHGCGGETPKAEDEFVIEGQLTNYPGQTLRLERASPGEAVLIDSTQTDQDGNFSFVAKQQTGYVFHVLTTDNKGIAVIPENDRIRVEGDIEEVNSSVITGNAASELFREMKLRQLRLYSEYDANRRQLAGVNRNVQLEKWRTVEARVDKSMIAYRQFLRDFADTTRFPVVAANTALSVNVDGNYYYLRKLVDRLLTEIPESPYVQYLDARLKTTAGGFERVQVPEGLQGENHRGEFIKLEDLRGKMVVLYFWASYCEFSRQENAELAKLYDQYKDRGLVILGYSVDDWPSDWKKAIAEQGIDWKWHLRGNDGAQSNVFNFFVVGAVPTTFLIDARGIQRSKNIRAQDLKADMEELLAKYGPESLNP